MIAFANQTNALARQNYMIAPRHLPQAPIQEAIVSLTIKKLDDSKISGLGSLPAPIAKDYSQCEDIFTHSFEFKIQRNEIAATSEKSSGQLGYKFTSTDTKNIVQFKLDGFAFSRLNPYETWENMRDEARKMWRVYADIVSPEYVTRVATRFINRFDIPIPIKDFDEYLAEPPRIPESLPQGLSRFMTRYSMHDPTIEATVLYTQAMEPITNGKTATLVLDIDVFRLAQFDANSEEVWELLEQMRILKNQVFFESITEKVVELCQ